MAVYELIDHQFDVVVVGAGGSGLRAALGCAQARAARANHHHVELVVDQVIRRHQMLTPLADNATLRIDNMVSAPAAQQRKTLRIRHTALVAGRAK